MSHPHPHSPLTGAHHRLHRPAEDAAQAEILDLDAEVLAEHTAAITAWLPLTSAPSRIVDLGCGTGAGTFALLDRFPTAHVTAVDSSPGHLDRLRNAAHAKGVADRVHTVRADLDADAWPDLGTPDLVWASASMHHLADPARVLRALHDLLAPGALLAVVELAGLPRFLPAGAPEERPGLEERCHAAADRLHAEHLPHRGADWGPMIDAAGFTLAGEHTVTVDMDGSHDPAVARYASGVLQRVRGAAAETLAAGDLAALDRLLDPDGPHSLLRRDDLSVRTERTVWAARRS
ncbi:MULTISPECIES: trans-aconitate 2-methyltransferase [unclassified Streptomyces]|uniref:class I SAM-dependent methyltransferase n=1 Tax=unclassified Streptomyces TaxID=2593676 RepID=UPI000CD541DB|nr:MULTISPECIES: class I SAM-dependent methyltransferase [unclassified Streptomyces]